MKCHTFEGFYNALLVSGEIPKSQHANYKTLFKNWALLLTGQDDLAKVDITCAKGLRKRWELEIEARQSNGFISGNTPRQYRMRGKKAVTWAIKNRHLFTKESGIENLDALDGQMWDMLEYLDQLNTYVERLAVQRLFVFMDNSEADLCYFYTHSDTILEEFETHLIDSGVTAKTWKSTYRDAIRGLKLLQKAGLLEMFPLRPHTSTRIPTYKVPYDQFPNDALRDFMNAYSLKASEQVKIGDESWQHPIVKDKTRLHNIQAIEQYIGYLEKCAKIDTATLTLNAVFSPTNLQQFGEFYAKNQDLENGDITNGLKSTIKRVKSLARKLLNLPKKDEWLNRFDAVYDKRRIASKRPKAHRIRSLSEWAEILDQANKSALNTSNEVHSACLQRLNAYLLVLLSAPARPGNIRTLELNQNLVKDPLTQVWWVRLTPQETKTNRAYNIPLPEFVALKLEHYLSEVRPKILKNISSQYVFPSAEGGPVATEVILAELAKLDAAVHGKTKEESVYPHSIRHTAVITCVRKLGRKALHRAGKLIGHETTATTRKFYSNNVRSLSGRDGQAEKIIKNKIIKREDIQTLLSMLAREPKELKRFIEAFQTAIP